MYTKKQLQQLRDSVLALKASDSVPFTDEGNVFRFACSILLEGCDPGFVYEKTLELKRFDKSGESYGLIYLLLFGDPIILPRYLDSIFSIIVKWRFDTREITPILQRN